MWQSGKSLVVTASYDSAIGSEEINDASVVGGAQVKDQYLPKLARKKQNDGESTDGLICFSPKRLARM
jgi:hypothetical protein